MMKRFYQELLLSLQYHKMQKTKKLLAYT